MELPREIRDIIYVHALVADHALYFIGSRFRNSAPVHLFALLRCNKTLNAETSPIFYRRNRFLLPIFPFNKPSAFATHATLFRHMIVKLTDIDCDDGTFGNVIAGNVEPIMDDWKPMICNLVSLTELELVELNVDSICSTGHVVDKSRSKEGIMEAITDVARRLLPDLTAALAEKVGRRAAGGRFVFRVTGYFAYDHEKQGICDAWKDLGAEYVRRM